MHVQSDRRCMAFYAMAQHAYSAYTALLATAERAPRRSATVLDVGTLSGHLSGVAGPLRRAFHFKR